MSWSKKKPSYRTLDCSHRESLEIPEGKAYQGLHESGSNSAMAWCNPGWSPWGSYLVPIRPFARNDEGADPAGSWPWWILNSAPLPAPSVCFWKPLTPQAALVLFPCPLSLRSPRTLREAPLSSGSSLLLPVLVECKEFSTLGSKVRKSHLLCCALRSVSFLPWDHEARKWG